LRRFRVKRLKPESLIIKFIVSQNIGQTFPVRQPTEFRHSGIRDGKFIGVFKDFDYTSVGERVALD
jgi:hypothetical protein